jgi:hypothetical protein
VKKADEPKESSLNTKYAPPLALVRMSRVIIVVITFGSCGVLAVASLKAVSWWERRSSDASAPDGLLPDFRDRKPSNSTEDEAPPGT